MNLLGAGAMRNANLPLALALTLAALTVTVLAAPSAIALPANIPDKTWQANENVLDIEYHGNVVYFAGKFTAVIPPGGGTPVSRNRAAAIDATTGKLLPWNPNVNGTVYALAVHGSPAKVYLGGSFSSVRGVTRKNLAQVDGSSGTPTGWNPTPSSIVRSMVTSNDGSKLYIGGKFTKVNGATRMRVAALSTKSNTLISGFAPKVEQLYAEPIGNTCRPRCPANVVALALSADGSKLYLGGTFGEVNDVPRNSGAAVNATTGATLRYDPNVWTDNSFNAVKDIDIIGKWVVLCGDFFLVHKQKNPNMAKTDGETGMPDRNFVAATDGAQLACATSSATNTIYVGGHFGYACRCEVAKNNPEGVLRNSLAAFNATTGQLLSWNPGENSGHGIFSMDLTVSKLAVGGEFTKIGGGGSGNYNQAHFAQFSGSP